MPSNAAASLRFLACLALLASLPGCERTPPPEAPTTAAATTPEEIPVASEAPPAPSALPVLLPFSTDDARINTEIGERSLGRGIATTGKTGWLMFGPYIALPAGHYQVEIRGSAYPGHTGTVHFDVAQRKGNDLLAAAEIDAPALLTPPSADAIAVLSFTLAAPASDLEVRVRVADTANLSISGYVIRSIP